MIETATVPAGQGEVRPAAQQSYGHLDAPRDFGLDDIARMAAMACGTPMALINLVDCDRQRLEAEVGLGIWQMPIEPSICTCTPSETDLLEIADLAADPRFAADPIVVSPPHARFYAGVPLRTPSGLPIGVLCVMDPGPGRLTGQQASMLRALGRIATARLEQGKAIAERDRALEIQRQTESRSRLILESSVDYAIVSFDLQARVTSWNEGARRILGWTEAEMIGRPADRIFIAEDVAADVPAAEMRDALIHGRGKDERWHIRKNGNHFWADGEIMALRDEAGEVTGFIKILRDRTEQRMAVRALRDNQERIETALDTGLVAFFDWDVGARLMRGDARFATFYGLDPARLSDGGVPLAEVVDTIHGADRAAVIRSVEAAQASDRAFSTQFRVVQPDGAMRHLLVRGHCYERDGERALRFTGVTIDISASKAAEQALRASEERYRSLFSSIDAGFCIVELAFDRDGRARDYRIVETNPAFASQTGIADGVGRWMREIAPNHEQHWFDRYGRVALTGEPTRFEAQAEALGRWFDVHAYPVEEPGGRHVAVLFNDITERRRTERALQELNATLEQRVAREVENRGHAEEALRQSQKMEAVGQLTGGVAHDFNNLLTIIRSSVDLLRRPDLPDARRRRYIDAVSDTVDRAAKLTGQLLAFARRQALKPEVFDVGERLRGLADMLDTVTGARIRVATELPERPCFVRADLSQFETAIVNMAVNARDAMDGEGVLTLRLVSGAAMPPIRGHAGAAGPFAAVSLTDTGSGIAPGQIDRIFEPFFTTKPVGKGTGLGLSQVFGFTKQSGGDIDVRSEAGTGTTFVFYLPEVEGDSRQVAEDELDPGPSAGGAGRRVLVVEDNIEVGKFSTQILQDLGYETTWAANAEEALGRLGEDGAGFDVVFSDVVMPGMGGIALAKWLRDRLPGLPVVLASGYSHVLAQEGAHGFELLHKPYSAEQLSRILRRVIRDRRRAMPGARSR